jgi:hypothetical protein
MNRGRRELSPNAALNSTAMVVQFLFGDRIRRALDQNLKKLKRFGRQVHLHAVA